jgi:hypothetical protein
MSFRALANTGRGLPELCRLSFGHPFINVAASCAEHMYRVSFAQFDVVDMMAGN